MSDNKHALGGFGKGGTRLLVKQSIGAAGADIFRSWFFDTNIVVPPGLSGGGFKYWTGIGWAVKPVKVWTGSLWAQKTVKRWNGSAWVST